METQGIAERMAEHIQGQVLLFRKMNELQTTLLHRLDSGEGMPEIMELLALKNQLLEQVKQRNLDAAALVSAWPQARKAMESKPEALQVNTLLDELEVAAKELRQQDEAMIHRFQSIATPQKPADKERHSQNVLNAFRAMR